MTTLLRTQTLANEQLDTGPNFGFKPQTRRPSSSSVSSVSTVTSQSSARSQYAVILVLSSLNNTFEKKSLIVPFYPEVVKLGRQTNAKTSPASDNGFFDSRVLSRQHAEVWTQRSTGKVFIKDVKSSNGTYINRERLSVENTESEPKELKKNDILELGIDISGEDGSTLVHRKIAARVERISIMSLQVNGSNGSKGARKTGNGYSNGSYDPNNSFLNSMNGSNGANGVANAPNGGSAQSNGQLYPINSYANKSDILDASLWGDVDSSLEDLIMGHANSSVAGALLKPAVTNSATFETAVKKLITEMHSAKLEGAKLRSVAKLLEEIRTEQKKSAVLSALSDQISVKEAYLAEVEQKYQQRTALQSEMDELKARTKTFDSIERELAFTKTQLKTAQDRVGRLEDEVVCLKRELDQSKLEKNMPKSAGPKENDILINAASTMRQSDRMATVVPVSTAVGVVLIGVTIMAVLREHFDRGLS